MSSFRKIWTSSRCYGAVPAGMVELVNAADSKSAGGDTLRVQVSLPVPERQAVTTAWPPFFLLDGLRLPPCHAPGRGQPGRVNGCLCAPAGPSTDRAGSASTPPAAYGKHAGSAATTRRTPNEKAAMWCRPRWQRGEPSAAGRPAPTARPPKRFVPS